MQQHVRATAQIHQSLMLRVQQRVVCSGLRLRVCLTRQGFHTGDGSRDDISVDQGVDDVLAELRQQADRQHQKQPPSRTPVRTVPEQLVDIVEQQRRQQASEQKGLSEYERLQQQWEHAEQQKQQQQPGDRGDPAFEQPAELAKFVDAGRKGRPMTERSPLRSLDDYHAAMVTHLRRRQWPSVIRLAETAHSFGYAMRSETYGLTLLAMAYDRRFDDAIALINRINADEPELITVAAYNSVMSGILCAGGPYSVLDDLFKELQQHSRLSADLDSHGYYVHGLLAQGRARQACLHFANVMAPSGMFDATVKSQLLRVAKQTPELFDFVPILHAVKRMPARSRRASP